MSSHWAKQDSGLTIVVGTAGAAAGCWTLPGVAVLWSVVINSIEPGKTCAMSKLEPTCIRELPFTDLYRRLFNATNKLTSCAFLLLISSSVSPSVSIVYTSNTNPSCFISHTSRVASLQVNSCQPPKKVRRSSGRYPNIEAAKYYDNNSNKLPRPDSCTPDTCKESKPCLWCQLPQKWEADAAPPATQPRKRASAQLPLKSLPEADKLMDASTALSNNVAEFKESQHQATLQAALCEHCGATPELIASKAVNRALEQDLVRQAAIPFADSCLRYHTAKARHLALTKERNTKPRAAMKHKEQSVEAEEALISRALHAAPELKLDSSNLMDQAKAALALNEIACDLAARMAALIKMYRELSKGKNHLIRQHAERQCAEHVLDKAKSGVRSARMLLHCRNTTALSWSQALENISNSVSTGIFHGRFKGPLEPQQLLSTLETIQECSPISLDRLLPEMVPCDRQATISQLICPAPVLSV